MDLPLLATFPFRPTFVYLHVAGIFRKCGCGRKGAAVAAGKKEGVWRGCELGEKGPSAAKKEAAPVLQDGCRLG